MSEPFDFDAFIAGTQLARGTVSFFKVDHRPEIARLTREHDALPVDGGDDREVSATSPRQELATRIKVLRTEMEDSRVSLTIRTLTPDEFRKVMDAETEEPYDQLALQSVEPVLTSEQWRKLADKIGTAQFKVICDDANALILSKVAVPDFSPTVSQTLSPRASSEN